MHTISKVKSFLLGALATSLIVVLCIWHTSTSGSATVLAGPYNVPYFSTFIVPKEHFTRGGLHQAAIPYERQLRSQGIIDNDREHVLNPSQAQSYL